MAARRGQARKFLEGALATPTDECLLWPFSTRNGYGQLMIRPKLCYVHVLVCERFHGPRPPGMEVAHGPCHTRRCFNPRHLSWKTPSENHMDKVRDGTIQRGERANGVKLTEREVREIRYEYGTGEWTQKQLAEEFKVSRTTIEGIVLGRRWSYA